MRAVDSLQRPTYDVVVVGAGVFGVATSLELARRGRTVLTVDRFGSGHPATSSTGASRSIRIAYDHPVYVRLALEALEAWERLEWDTGRTILHLTGQVDLGPVGKLQAIEAAVREAGATLEEIDRPTLDHHFPELVLDPGDAALFQHRAGTVIADAGLVALRTEAIRLGVTYVPGLRVTRIEPGTPVAVHADGATFHADQVVVAAGPWTGELLDGFGLHLPLAPAIAQVTFLDAPALVDRPGLAEWPPDGEVGVYGHAVPGVGYKVGFDAGSDAWDPDMEAWEPDLDEQDHLVAWLARRMPSVEPRISKTQRHPWTMTPDVDFIIDRWGPVVVACGCSGHAFKFGPTLGRVVADVVDGGRPPDLFRLDRPSLTHATVSATAPISR